MKLQQRLGEYVRQARATLTPGRVVLIVLGNAILSFGLVNVHRAAGLSEGGSLGMLLLLNHWLGVSTALLSPVLDALCYAVAYRFLGKRFLLLSALSAVSLAGCLALWEGLGPLLPSLAAQPLWAALAGGAFVGVGVGLVVRQGGATSGDDGLAMALSKRFGCRISLVYLVSDITVLALSLTYIPLTRIAWSVVTVLLSSLLIDAIRSLPRRKARPKSAA